jgi:hypothetical protein
MARSCACAVVCVCRSSGHYVPEMANLVLEGNKLKRPEDRINIKGIAVGNPGVESGSLHLSPSQTLHLTHPSLRARGRLVFQRRRIRVPHVHVLLRFPPRVWLFEFLCFDLIAGWLVGWLVGRSVGRSIGRSVGWLVG